MVKKLKHKRIIPLLVFVNIIIATFIFFIHSIAKENPNINEGQVYSTWETLELDKCASAWLIKRFVDKNAQFQFFPNGTFIKEGIPFDTPTGELSRDARAATFGKILQKYKLKNSVLEDINKIVWDVEVNKWEKKVTDEAIGLSAVINGLILISKDGQECFEKSFIVFDALYAHLKARRQVSGMKNE
ncbi:chromate resistance protein [bacterium]|nr:chromate resistance protein [bacterium]